MAKRLGLALSLGAAVVGAVGWSAAAAQYPAPLGLCVVTPASPTANANSTVSYTITTTATDGKPAPGVPGTVAIGAQPGGSTVSNSSYTTDGQGKATVSVTTGGDAGNLQLNVTAGTLSCSSVVMVVAQKTNPDVIKPPDTGMGYVSQGGFDLLPAALGGMLALVTAGSAAFAAARREK